MSWTEITILVDKAKLGDRQAYGELVTRFQSSVYAMALARVRNPLEAQELAQEVFVHAMKKLPQLRDARCFAGWLRRITARMAINRLTRKGPLFGTEPEMLDAVASGGKGPAENLELTEAKAQLHAGLTRLKPEDRATLEAFYLRGRSLKQMAREFEAPVGTIKRRLFVARARLKDVLVGSGGGDFDTGEFPATERRAKRKDRELVGV
ncbi:RNA polymerase sigma factor [Fimbriiglobus ruber]|uniref:RNA polymerase sigma factor RpoE n=1 Tax=Fimbriiglobus ruber TaxID=1908690 RepID=A0A225DH82_9BACT|nr:sigma-70 family RNA polymerase sigma factor [Fimbriiglobus ruber]OWK37908.1 RNA polymerase sigma factor RpoE [Fimbriiglobus ruber]